MGKARRLDSPSAAAARARCSAEHGEGYKLPVPPLRSSASPSLTASAAADETAPGGGGFGGPRGVGASWPTLGLLATAEKQKPCSRRRASSPAAEVLTRDSVYDLAWTRAGPAPADRLSALRASLRALVTDLLALPMPAPRSPAPNSSHAAVEELESEEDGAALRALVGDLLALPMPASRP